MSVYSCRIGTVASAKASAMARVAARIMPHRWRPAALVFAGAACVLIADRAVLAAGGAPLDASGPWWLWPLLVFLVCAALGVLAVLGGIGGSVMFVPVLTGFTSVIHIDFLRAAGLMVAFTGALAAAPSLIRQGLANIRLGMPAALIASVTAIAGAMVGLAMPSNLVQLSLGLIVLAMAFFMVLVRPTRVAPESAPRGLTRLLRIEGYYRDVERNLRVTWRPRRAGAGLALFSLVGVMGGMFGVGSGWANVPVFNLVMGVPLKVAVATSQVLMLAVAPTAALVYFRHGAMLPLLVIPAVLGMTIGARIGARLLFLARPALIRKLVIAILIFAGLRALTRGLGL
ncbi:MAG: sulfite exporter TauE/SafE family protein [Candidatus Lambdaproteobacteria bacterium]|nr:sulfite exporter TauE/SafE family protein [Candidatus Lambdaproteobacteria bacterium]